MRRTAAAGDETTLREFFAGHPEALEIYRAIAAKVEPLGGVDATVSKSQIALRRRRSFAWIWRPGQYLRAEVAPVVLSLSLPDRDSSPRWKEIVEPRPGRYMHHLELSSPVEVDSDVEAWLARAHGFAA